MYHPYALTSGNIESIYKNVISFLYFNEKTYFARTPAKNLKLKFLQNFSRLYKKIFILVQ